MFVVDDCTGLEDKGHFTKVFLAGGESMKLNASFQDVFDAVSIRVAVGLNITAGTPVEQS